MARVAFGPLGPMVARAPVRSMTFAGVPLGLKLEFSRRQRPRESVGRFGPDPELHSRWGGDRTGEPVGASAATRAKPYLPWEPA